MSRTGTRIERAKRLASPNRGVVRGSAGASPSLVKHPLSNTAIDGRLSASGGGGLKMKTGIRVVGHLRTSLVRFPPVYLTAEHAENAAPSFVSGPYSRRGGMRPCGFARLVRREAIRRAGGGRLDTLDRDPREFWLGAETTRTRTAR